MVLGENPGPTVCGKGREGGSVTTMREEGHVPGGPSWCTRADSEKAEDTTL